jgi:hypothetical protein
VLVSEERGDDHANPVAGNRSFMWGALGSRREIPEELDAGRDRSLRGLGTG